MHCELNCEVGVGNGRNKRNLHFSMHPRKRKKRQKKEKAENFSGLSNWLHTAGVAGSNPASPTIKPLEMRGIFPRIFCLSESCPNPSTLSGNFCTFMLAFLRIFSSELWPSVLRFHHSLITFRRLSYFTQGRVVAVSIIDPVNVRRIHHDRPG